MEYWAMISVMNAGHANLRWNGTHGFPVYFESKNKEQPHGTPVTGSSSFGPLIRVTSSTGARLPCPQPTQLRAAGKWHGTRPVCVFFALATIRRAAFRVVKVQAAEWVGPVRAQLQRLGRRRNQPQG